LDLPQFIRAICHEGIREVETVYGADDQRRQGAIDAFNEMLLTKTPDDIFHALQEAAAETEKARNENSPAYWYWRYRHLQIEWVGNVVSVLLQAEGLPVIVPPTYRGLLRAKSILGA
jgi:hypothetical protein